MKNNITSIESKNLSEEFQKDDQVLLGISDLLIITSLEDVAVYYINDMVDTYCGILPESILKNEVDFYKDFLHPEDYQTFLIHLKSCKKLKKWEILEIVVRLKDNNGNWVKYCFKNRLYYWSKENKPNCLISLVNKVPLEILQNPQVDDCNIPKRNSNSEFRKTNSLIESLDEAFCKIELIFNKENVATDYLFLDTNAAFEKHVNIQNPKGRTMRELIPDHEEHWFKTYGDVALTGRSIRFQQQGEKLDQSWFDLYAFKLGGETSRKVAVMFKNITQQKNEEERLKKEKGDLEKQAIKNQQKLLENNQLLQTVFDTNNLAIAVFQSLYNKDGKVYDFRFIRVNKVLMKMYLDKDPLGKTYLETSQHGVKLGIYDAFIHVMETGEVLDKEVYYDLEGYNHWFRIHGRRQNNLLIVSIEDISAKKAALLKLEETLRFNRQLIETSPDTILIINLNDFVVRYINQDMLKRAGMTKSKIKGMHLTEMITYIHPRDREKIIDFHKKILKSEDSEVLDLEFRVKTKGKTWEWFNARGKIFNRQDSNWVNEYVILVRNITEQINTQNALISAEKLSIQGEVAKTFAHELRNPLASIRMATDVIKYKLEEPQLKLISNYLEILSRSTKVLDNMVSHLLNTSKYSPAVLENKNLAEILNETLEMASDRIYLNGINLIKQFKGPYWIYADKEKLKIALLNIIVNASEAITPQEGIIKVNITKHKTDFVLSISDNGHGLEKEQINHLFDAFYTNKANGVGIGLNSVKNILEEHDAHIEVDSKPNIGTTFKIFFHNLEHK